MTLVMVRNVKAISFNSKMENNTDILCLGTHGLISFNVPSA